MLAGYGDILYRAWRDSSGACRLEVEDLIQACAGTCSLSCPAFNPSIDRNSDIISVWLHQGLMQSALVAKTPGLNGAIRNVLNGLHAQKTHAAVDAMLLRLYEPVLFRGLAATNANVRRNAMLVLFDAFPLEVRPYEGFFLERIVHC